MSVLTLTYHPILTNIPATTFWSRPEAKIALLDFIKQLDFLVEFAGASIDSLKISQSPEVSSSNRHTVEPRQIMGRRTVLPFNPPPFFFGRQDMLDRLYAFFNGARVSDTYGMGIHPRAFVLWGMPGVGKTQIAITVACMLRKAIPNIFWISSEKPDNLMDGFMGIANQIDEIPKSYLSDRKLVISAVKKWFEHSSQEWLLVFDNVSDSTILAEFWPSGEKGRVLVTTRHAGPLQIYTQDCEHVTPFSNSEGSELFRKILPEDLIQDAGGSEIISTLVTELGGLPLAIIQAAGYMCEHLCSASKYLSLLKNRVYSVSLLDRVEHMQMPYSVSVNATFKLVYEAIRHSNREAQRLLDLLSWLDPDKIPEDILNPSQGLFRGNQLLFEEAMAALLDAGLLLRSNAFVSIHRLVQATNLSQMGVESRLESFQRSVTCIKASFPSALKFGSLFPLNCPPFDNVRHVLSQILALSQKYREWEIEEQLPDLGELCNWTGSYFLEISNMEGSQKMFRQSHEIYENIAECRQGMAIAAGGLGWLLMREGKLIQALDMASKAVVLMEAAVGPRHAYNAWVLANRGRIHLFNGEILQSLEDTRRSFTIMIHVDEESQNSEESARALSIYRTSYAISLYAQARGGFSGDLYEPSLGSRGCPVGGGTEPDEREALEVPIKLCRESIQVLSERAGWENSLAWMELTLSWMLLYVGDITAAESTTQEALKHVQKDYPLEICGVGVTKIQLADCYSQQGKFMQAMHEYYTALKNLEHSVGHQNPLYIIGSYKWANFLCRLGRYGEARGQYESCLNELTKLYGESNQTTMMVENNLGIVLVRTNEQERGMQLLRASLAYREKRYGGTHKLTKRARLNYGIACSLLDEEGIQPLEVDAIERYLKN